MLRDAVLAAALAGIGAALILSVLQFQWVTPLILTGESYEDRAEAVAQSHESAPVAEHIHDDGGWQPQKGLERSLFSAVANILIGIGYALVLIAVFMFWHAPSTPFWGAMYGLAGFVVFFAAPALGLPPELPGTAAAELTARQEWWAMTALATGAGLLLFFAQPRSWIRLFAVALVIAPHFISAPHPAIERSLAPAALQEQFRLATTLCNAAFWVALGVFTTIAYRKLRGVAPAPRPEGCA